MGEKKLLDAFNSDFIELLQKPRFEIEGELIQFLKYLKENSSKEKRFFENVESRIKSVSSFEEKIKRKNYIDCWDIKSIIQENQDLICEKLPDLIGFRINCFFIIDEKYIYDKLRNYFQDKKFSEKITLNFDENIKQKNGHTLYKVTGKFDKKYSFELQIKSLMHNLWGEVEHKTIYKSCDYNVNQNSKKIITEQIFNILNASDKQLLTVFSETQDEKQLIQSLFFIQTKSEISKKFGTSVLANHYNSFFSIFKNTDTYEMIKDFVGKTLIDERKALKIYSNDEFSLNTRRLKELVNSTFIDYNIKILHEIYSLIMEFKDFETFELYMLEFITIEIQKYSEGNNSEDAFGDSEDDSVNHLNNDIITYLKDYLEVKEALK